MNLPKAFPSWRQYTRNMKHVKHTSKSNLYHCLYVANDLFLLYTSGQFLSLELDCSKANFGALLREQLYSPNINQYLLDNF